MTMRFKVRMKMVTTVFSYVTVTARSKEEAMNKANDGDDEGEPAGRSRTPLRPQATGIDDVTVVKNKPSLKKKRP